MTRNPISLPCGSINRAGNQLLYDGEQPPAPANRGESKGEADEWGSYAKDARMSERDRQVLMSLARILIKTQIEKN